MNRESQLSDSLSTSLLELPDNENPKEKTYAVGFFITLPVFMMYACCFSLQQYLSEVFGLSNGIAGDSRSKIYGVATSFVYFFNLIFRVFGHNICFSFLQSYDRVIVALIASTISMAMLTILSFAKEPPSLAWVFISYAIAGVCEGTYGPNMLNVCSHLGETRHWIVLAMPVGISLISLGAFCLIALGVPFWVFYIITGVFSFIAIIVYVFTIYPASKKIASEITPMNMKEFLKDLKYITTWFPKIAWRSACLILDMVCLALFNPGCTLYVYNERVTFRILGGITISHDWFLVIYNSCTFLGDFLGRKFMDGRKLIHPLWFMGFIVCGLCLNLVLIPEIAPLAGFLFMWANGGLYTQSTRFIDEVFPDQFNLIATSAWLFLGDIGSTTGSNLVQFLRIVLSDLKKVSL